MLKEKSDHQKQQQEHTQIHTGNQNRPKKTSTRQ